MIIVSKNTKKEEFIHILRRNWYPIICVTIILLAFYTRFIHFNTHWAFAGDEARDAAIAKQAILRNEVPFHGSFSSAGPFVIGPLFYWFIMSIYLVAPILQMPWVVMGFLNVLTIILLMIAGRLLADKRLSILIGFIAVLSPQLLSRALSLGNNTMILPLSAGIIVLFLLFWQKKKIIYVFVMGLLVGCAINMHYQALNLLIFAPAVVFTPGISYKKRVTAFFLVIIGVFIPLTPLLLWDSQQEWSNIRNILDYFLVAQYCIYVPNSWKLFLFTYFPLYWSIGIGGTPFLAIISLAITGGVIGISVLRKNISSSVLVLSIIFAIFLIVNRYYRGERFEGYLLYLLPLIIILFGWACYQLIFNSSVLFGKRIGYKVIPISTCIILYFIFSSNAVFIQKELVRDNGVNELYMVYTNLIKKTNTRKFSVYDYKGKTMSKSQPFSVLLSDKNAISKDGMKIGFICANCESPYKRIFTLSDGTKLVALQVKDPLYKEWLDANPETMYEALIGWGKRHELKASFSLIDYFKSKNLIE